MIFRDLGPSPNNVKVRMALRFKGIEFETRPVDYRDRRPLVEISGQELSPVIEDRGIVLNDSEAILQYLDANHRDTPRLFPARRAGRKECDGWKERLDADVVACWLPVFLVGIGRQETFDSAARDRYEAFLRRLNDELGDRDSFKGPEMAICDLRVAQWALYAFPGPGLIERVPLFRRFEELYAVPRGELTALERFLDPWNERMV